MKTKYSLIPFIPALIAMLGIKLMSLFGLDESGQLFGLNVAILNYIVIAIAVGLFLLCILINIFDRKTAPVYAVRKNIVAGVFAVFSGAMIAASSAISFINAAPDSSDYYLMNMVVALFAIPAAISCVLMGKVHFVGKSTVSRVSFLYIFPSLWACSNLVSVFLNATKVSIAASDMTSLFCFIFITLYFFSYSMIVSRIKGRNPVKACFIYGFPAVALSLSYGAFVIARALIENSDVQTIVSGALFIVIAFYALSFIMELFSGAVTKDEVEIIDGVPEEEDTYESSYIKSGGYDELLFSNRTEEQEAEEQSEYGEFSPKIIDNFNDFVIGYEKDDNVNYSENMPNAFDDVIINSKSKNIPDIVIKAPENTEPAQTPEEIVEPEKNEKEPEKETPIPELNFGNTENVISEDRLNEIDRLLAELEDKK